MPAIEKPAAKSTAVPDLDAAGAVMIEGAQNCAKYQRYMADRIRESDTPLPPNCNCDDGKLDGCIAIKTAIAKAIAAARQ